MNTEKIINDLESIIERISERTRHNDWASSSFLWERADEIKKVIKSLTKN